MTGVSVLNFVKNEIFSLPEGHVLHNPRESWAVGWNLDSSTDLCGRLAACLVSGPLFPHQQPELFKPRSLLGTLYFQDAEVGQPEECDFPRLPKLLTPK